MNITNTSRSHPTVLLQSAAAVLLALGAAQATAHSVVLCAEPYTQAVPGNALLPMWGYRQVGSVAACDTGTGVATASPGPLITVPAGDSTLAITVVNRLSVPTSIVLAAQSLPSDGGPAVMAADVVGPTCVPTPTAASTAAAHPQNCRVRSFTGETDPGANRTYTFINIRPGTYLYQSGTHPQVQVQMGLFGMARQDATVLGASGRQLFAGANAGFDVDVPVVLSEIDPEQHIRIAATLGSADPTSWKSGNNSTLNYVPKFFLINGKMFDAANPDASDLPVTNAASGARVVLRIANAGLQSRSLVLNSGTWKLQTEDGYPYRVPREQATVLLPAGKTTDALLISSAPASGIGRSIAIFDRRGGTDNGDGSALGGQVARLAQSAPVGPQLQAVANQVANEGSNWTLQLVGTGATSYALTGAPTDSAWSFNPVTGALAWTPVPTGTPANTSYALSAAASDGTLTSPAQNFSLRINHAPLLTPPAAQAVNTSSVNIALLATATDIDLDTLTPVLTSSPAAGTAVMNANGTLTYTRPASTATTPNAAGTYSYSYRVGDPFGLSSPVVSGSLNVAANMRPLANNLGTPATAGYSIILKTGLGQALVAFQLADPSPLKIPYGSLVTASDADGNVLPASFTVTGVTKVDPVSGVVVARTGALGAGLGGAEATAVLSADASTITFTPRRSVLQTLVFTGGIDSSTNSRGTYRISYTVRDNEGLTSTPGNIFVRVP